MDEQLFWARQLQNLGLAGDPLPAKKVTAQLLAKAIRTVLATKSMQEKARGACQTLKSHDGVASALSLLALRQAQGEPS
jgi:UDP:flavonoid glycosyltransferase YjiC (YdhE family)